MKNIMKQIAVGLMVGLLAVTQVNAIEAVFTVPTANGAVCATNLINGAIRVYEIEITQGALAGSMAFNWVILDSPATNSTRGPAQGYSLSTYSNGTYITYGSYTTNITKTVTNFAGLGTNSAAGVLGGTWSTNQTYSGLWTYSVTNAATTNNYNLKFAGTGPSTSGGIITIPIGDNGMYFSKGLTWTNGLLATNVTVTVRYEPAR